MKGFLTSVFCFKSVNQWNISSGETMFRGRDYSKLVTGNGDSFLDTESVHFIVSQTLWWNIFLGFHIRQRNKDDWNNDEIK